MEELETPPEGAMPEPDTSGPVTQSKAAEAVVTPPPDAGEPFEIVPSPAGDEAGAAPEEQVEDAEPGDSREAELTAESAAAAPPAEAEPVPTPDGEEATATPEPQSEVGEPADTPAAEAAATSETVSMDELLGSDEPAPVSPPASVEDTQLRAVLEAIVYVAEEPLTLAQLAVALQQPASRIKNLLEQLVIEFDKPEHGVTIREVAGGFKMATKPEHHDAVRSFVKSLKPPLKLSLPALETLAVIAYKQPVTSPEIMEIRGVRGAGVLNTLLDRKLIAAAGRKNVIGKPILYKTTKEFLIQFGLKDLSELPSLKEFEEIRRMAFADSEVEPAAEAPATEAPAAETPAPAPAAEAAPPAPEAIPEAPAAPESQET